MKGDTYAKSGGFPFPRTIGAAVLCAFFVSGVCGLLHEIVWTRLLRHVMGNDTFSVTTVLCTFMAGLALGSYVGGRWIDRRRDPLRVFAILEGTIGLYCLMLPVLIELLQPIFGQIYRNTSASFYVFSLTRFFFCGLLLLVPATFMGATLPVLARFFVRAPQRIGWPVGMLYGINTFGAVVGTAVTGFLLIPKLGVKNTIYLGCLLNFAICGAGMWLFVRAPEWSAEEEQGEEEAEMQRAGGKPAPTVNSQPEAISMPDGRWVLFIVLAGYGLSGFAALVYEIAWTRALTLMIGSSVYAFTLMLSAFILGLAAGSMIYARFADRARDPLLHLAVIEAAIGLSALCVLSVFGKLPFYVTRLIADVGGSFWLLQLTEFALVLALMLVPTTLMGAAFPLAARLVAQTPAAIGRSVGTVYGCNTLGSIFGAFAGGFILIPLLGIRGAALGAVLVNVVVACALFGCTLRSVRPGLPRLSRALAAAAVVLVMNLGIVLTPEWDPAHMSFGPYRQAHRMPSKMVRSVAALEREAALASILYHREGLTTTVTIKEYATGERVLVVNGKPDASSFTDLPTQELLAHLPLLLHPHPRDALVIGLASGVTFGSAGRHPLQVLDCVEISPEVVEASRFFDEYNYRILDDPRVRVVVADGRSHLSLSGRTYDVIISEPTNPWIAGVGDLFTLEFFRLCRRRLNPGGIACIWLADYNLDLEGFRSIVRTFHSVFEHVTLWNAMEGDYLMIGSERGPSVDLEVLTARMAVPPVAADLGRINIRTVPELLAHLVTNTDGVERLSWGAAIHTDDNALLEFGAPRNIFVSGSDWAIDSAIEQHRKADLSFLVGNANPESAEALAAVKEEASRYIEADGELFHARTLAVGGRPKEAIDRYRRLLSLRSTHVIGHYELAKLLRKQGDLDGAMTHYEYTTRLKLDHAEAHNNLAVLLTKRGRLESAIRHYRLAIRAQPALAEAHYNLGVALERAGRPDEARISFRAALLLNPDLTPLLDANGEDGSREVSASPGASVGPGPSRPRPE